MTKQHIKPWMEIEDKKTGKKFLVTKVDKEKNFAYAFDQNLEIVTLGLDWARCYKCNGIWHIDDLKNYFDIRRFNE